jgi:hypothetical protein
VQSSFHEISGVRLTSWKLRGSGRDTLRGHP